MHPRIAELEAANAALEARVVERTHELALTREALRAKAAALAVAESCYRTLFEESQQDINERLEAERARHDAEDWMRFALKASGIGIWEMDLQAGTSHWSDICEELHGLLPRTFARTRQAFLDCVHPEDRERIARAIDQPTDERPRVEFDYRTVWPDGTEHQIRSTTHFVFDDSGTAVRAAGIAVDVTDRLRLEQQLRQSQKMEAVGQLAGGIAHDFNNLLTVIVGTAEILMEELPATDARRGDAEEIHRAGQRAARLTTQLLAFSRRQILAPRVLRLGDVVTHLAPMLRRLLPAGIRLEIATDEARRAKADPGQVEQIVMNLAINARDAMPDGGGLTITTADVDLDDAHAQQHPGANPGPHVVIAVGDTGHGMDAATQQRIFEPFFTTKAPGRGTGLGLATVYGIVQQSGGHMSVESDVGRGTTFRIFLPSTDEGAVAEQAPQADSGSLHGSETILLVEDEELVQNLVWRTLRRYGYTVRVANTPSQAIEFSKAYANPIDLILTDVVLPEMSGRAMVAQIQQHRDAKVLYMSGFTDSGIVHHGVLDAGTVLLRKPFSRDVLARTVREALDGDQRM
ncbi:MAG TPA: ATP-binding protein [Vicinamibacterales bacterium]|nr:ATP-binding protein [Vicinamibacterales bacterium]